jgi:hypothetical protein
MSFFRRSRPRTWRYAALDPASAWNPDMPPRPQGPQQPRPQMQWPAGPRDRGYMTGGIDHPECDPCGAGPIGAHAKGKNRGAS